MLTRQMVEKIFLDKLMKRRLKEKDQQQKLRVKEVKVERKIIEKEKNISRINN